MSYERKSLQILSGGYNALPPVDKIPITDYLLAQNWRSDALGKLVSRPGYPRKFTIAAAGLAHSAASIGGINNAYYVGCNSGVSNPIGSVYYNGALIGTGFDGRRIAFASQNGFMYIMNRGKQGRHSVAGGFQPWNLTPPPASLFAAAGSSPAPVASVNYTYPWQGEVVAAAIVPGTRTVTPGHMTDIVVGMSLGCSNNDYSTNYETVTVDSVTATTFTAPTWIAPSCLATSTGRARWPTTSPGVKSY